MKDKIYYFQEKSNDILDLQDEFTAEEIGIYFILKAAYFKYFGDLKKDNLCQRCKYFGDKDKLTAMVSKLFEVKEDLLINNVWLSEINNIKEKSEKRKEAANERWTKEKGKQNGSKTEAKRKQTISKDEANDNVNDNKNDNNIKSKKDFLEEDFEEFWKAYTPIETKEGKKVDKGSKKLAKVSYMKLRKIYDADIIFNGAANYLVNCFENNRLSCQAVVFLNQERFLNEFDSTTIKVV